ncbi:MAG TPA: hypothetical protein P5526_10435, partial [Anaerolineae bacterium]|nr:hypothetical protein [Anaerolineae bacterium]
LSPDEVALKWDGDRLKELVARRIEVSANGTLSDVFDDGDVTAGKSILDYMAERTMLRPRDMIQFCVFAREMAIQLGMFKINNESIQKAKFLYSDYMRKEIQDESKALEHDIGMLFEILREVGSDTVNKKTFLRKCRLRDISNEETALQQLIDLSVLGLHRATVRDDHSQEVLYRYSTSLWDHLEPLADTYFVHPSLKPELRLEK